MGCSTGRFDEQPLNCGIICVNRPSLSHAHNRPNVGFSMLHSAAGRIQPNLFDGPDVDETGPFKISPIPAVNVACVAQYSPLRYPGGKTWLIPHVRYWLQQFSPAPRLLVEPFAGGGIVSLTAVIEGLVKRCLMVEMDHDVAAFWHAALRHGGELSARVEEFSASRPSVQAIVEQAPNCLIEHGFRTLVLNRTRRGGILAPGASLSRAGENGKGIASRWYPETLTSRLRTIHDHRGHIGFCEGDGLMMLESLVSASEGCVCFVDPPYTAGGKRAGKRLYAHNDLDHARLFAMLDDGGIPFLMTYDRAPEIERLIHRHRFHAVQVLMKNTHHARIPELVITPKPVFRH